MNKPHKHAAIIKAWADGAQIQEINDNHVWKDVGVNGAAVLFSDISNYRIKPKEPIVKYLYIYVGSGGDMGLCRADSPLKNNCVGLSFDPDSGELLYVQKL